MQKKKCRCAIHILQPHYHSKKYTKENETFFQQSLCQRLKGSTNLTEMGEEEHGEMAILGGEGKSPSSSWRQMSRLSKK